jgi:hypothetical protein
MKSVSLNASTEIVRLCWKLYLITGAISECNEVGFFKISIENHAQSIKTQQILNVKNDTVLGRKRCMSVKL